MEAMEGKERGRDHWAVFLSSITGRLIGFRALKSVRLDTSLEVYAYCTFIPLGRTGFAEGPAYISSRIL